MSSQLYYKVDSTKISYGEYWRLSNRRVGTFLIGVVKK